MAFTSDAPVTVDERVPHHLGPLSDELFELVRDLAETQAGLVVAEGKRAFVAARLSRRVRDLELASYDEYLHHLRNVGSSEHSALLDALTTRQTAFFREPAHFEFLKNVLVPRWTRAVERDRRSAVVKVWSAGCATGEEAHSLAMVLLASAAPAGLRSELLATDLSPTALDVARRGIYPLARAHEIPETFRRAFMLKGVGASSNRMRVGAELSALTTFHHHNLVTSPFPERRRFDVIFCRNVLIYFARPTRARVIASLVECLAPGGTLFVGHAEGLHGLGTKIKSVSPAVYSLDPDFGGTP